MSELSEFDKFYAKELFADDGKKFQWIKMAWEELARYEARVAELESEQINRYYEILHRADKAERELKEKDKQDTHMRSLLSDELDCVRAELARYKAGIEVEGAYVSFDPRLPVTHISVNEMVAGLTDGQRVRVLIIEDV